MTAYRFCRTDDIGLLVSAYESCRGPEDAGEPPLDREGFKRLVRQLDLWCSSCMVALEGPEPVGVLLGAKRDDATLVYGLRVHPEHRRRGHGRHLLTSLGQKLAILGPPRLVAEVPAQRGAARALFESCRWRQEARLQDWRRVEGRTPIGPGANAAVGPVTLDEAVASGLLHAEPLTWQRDLSTLRKHAESLVGLGFHSPDRVEACLLARPAGNGWELQAAGCAPTDLGRLGLRVLVSELARRADGSPLVAPRLAPTELDPTLLAELGFTPETEHLLFATEAQAA